jgi:hypothetical protein
VRAGARPIEFWSEAEARVGPGDSGGALLNAEGELLGMPSLQVHYAGDSAGRAPQSDCLFIPVKHLRRAYFRMRQDPPEPWAWLGLQLEDPLMAARSGAPWQDGTGARVRRVFRDSPAAQAGFEPGDRLISIGSRRVGDIFDALDAVLDLDVGTGIPVRVERAGRRLVIGVVTGARPADPRPGPMDDFTLHTGLRLERRPASRAGHEAIAFSSITVDARLEIPAIEADLFAEGPLLDAILPGSDLLGGSTRHVPVESMESFSEALSRCFVDEQFVALVHWTLGASRTLDRAYVHRKLYPAVI